MDAEELLATKPKILTHRVMEAFFTRVLSEDKPISTLTLVSPWISFWESGQVGLTPICNRINERKIRTLLLTRPPVEEWHKAALQVFRECRLVSIAFIPDLHAKIFVCEAVPVGFGLIGSANLTGKSLTNFEIGLLFEGRGIFSPLLKELKIIAWNDLRRCSRSYE